MWQCEPWWRFRVTLLIWGQPVRLITIRRQDRNSNESMQSWTSLAGQFKSVLERLVGSFHPLKIRITAPKSTELDHLLLCRITDFFICVIFFNETVCTANMRAYRCQNDLVFSSVRVWFHVSGCISDTAAVSFFTAANLTSGQQKMIQSQVFASNLWCECLKICL